MSFGGFGEEGVDSGFVLARCRVQGELPPDGNRVRQLCIVSNRAEPKGGRGLDPIRWRRQKAVTIEHAHDVPTNEIAGAALPNQKFGANAARRHLNVILYNLVSAYGRAGQAARLFEAAGSILQRAVDSDGHAVLSSPTMQNRPGRTAPGRGERGEAG